MYKKAFWALIIITIISMILQIGGYEILETVMFLIIMDFTALWLYLEKRKSLTEIDNSIIKKIENLETACSSISESINAVSSVLKLEEKIDKQKEDINYIIEKLNKKTLDLEEKINKFGQSLTNSLANLNSKKPEILHEKKEERKLYQENADI